MFFRIFFLIYLSICIHLIIYLYLFIHFFREILFICLVRGRNIETIYYFCASILCEDQLIVVKITQVSVILPQVIVWSATAHSAQEVILPQAMHGEVSHWSSLSLRGHSASKLQLIENCNSQCM